MFEGGFGRTELGDVLLELGALVTVFYEVWKVACGSKYKKPSRERERQV